jgi:hypothetical protein
MQCKTEALSTAWELSHVAVQCLRDNSELLTCLLVVLSGPGQWSKPRGLALLNAPYEALDSSSSHAT